MGDDREGRLDGKLKAFEGYLARNGRSAGTRRKYLDDLETFARWLGDRNPGSLRRSEIEEYLGGWWHEFEERAGRSPALGTYRAKITALKAFFSFLDAFDYLVDDEGRPTRNVVALIDSPRIETKPIDWLTAEEDKALIENFGTPNENILVSLLPASVLSNALPIAGDQIKKVLGNDVVAGVAAKLGISPQEAADKLAEEVPKAVDEQTPGGTPERPLSSDETNYTPPSVQSPSSSRELGGDVS